MASSSSSIPDKILSQVLVKEIKNIREQAEEQIRLLKEKNDEDVAKLVAAEDKAAFYREVILVRDNQRAAIDRELRATRSNLQERLRGAIEAGEAARAQLDEREDKVAEYENVVAGQAIMLEEQKKIVSALQKELARRSEASGSS